MSRLFLLSVGLALWCPGHAQVSRLTLPQAIAEARRSSPVLRGVRADLNSKLASEGMEQAMTGPALTANGFATTGNNSGLVTSAPRTQPAATMQVPSGSFASGNLMLMLPLVAGDLRAIADSARWQSRASRGEYQEAELDIDLKVTEAYVAVQYRHEEVFAADSNLRAVSELLRTIQAKVETGSAIEASALRVMAEKRRAEREFVKAKNDEAKALLDLKHVMGVSLDLDFQLEPLSPPSDPQGLLGNLISAAKKGRGALLAAKALSEAASSEVDAAKALSQPRVYASAMAGVASRQEMGGLLVGLAVSFPVFDSGRIRSEVLRAKAMKDKADAILTNVELQIEKEVRQAFIDVETSTVNLSSAEAGLSSSEAAYAVIKLRVDAGKSILLEQLDSLESLARSRSDLAQARLDLFISIARLLRATGGHQ